MDKPELATASGRSVLQYVDDIAKEIVVLAIQQIFMVMDVKPQCRHSRARYVLSANCFILVMRHTINYIILFLSSDSIFFSI